MDFHANTAWKNSATRKLAWFLGFLCLLRWKLRRWSVLPWEGKECSLSNILPTANAEGAPFFITLHIKIANIWFSPDEFSGMCSRAKHGPRWTHCPLPPWKLRGLPLDASAPCSIASVKGLDTLQFLMLSIASRVLLSDLISRLLTKAKTECQGMPWPRLQMYFGTPEF